MLNFFTTFSLIWHEFHQIIWNILRSSFVYYRLSSEYWTLVGRTSSYGINWSTVLLSCYFTSVNRKCICKFSSGQTLIHQARFQQLNKMVLFRKVLFWKIFSSKLDLISSIKTYNSGNKGKTKTEQLICQRLPATYIPHLYPLKC